MLKELIEKLKFRLKFKDVTWVQKIKRLNFQDLEDEFGTLGRPFLKKIKLEPEENKFIKHFLIFLLINEYFGIIFMIFDSILYSENLAEFIYKGIFNA